MAWVHSGGSFRPLALGYLAIGIGFLVLGPLVAQDEVFPSSRILPCPLTPPSATPKTHTQKSLVVSCPLHLSGSRMPARSAGKNACSKAAYNSRSSIEFEGTKWQEPRTYNFSSREPPAYHEIPLPEGADPKFQIPQGLWNHAEQKENRRNSRSALKRSCKGIHLPKSTVTSPHRVKLFLYFPCSSSFLIKN
ncbi:MAG: hypothetical protein K940chlam9_01546 [Chlamydiae bacterium]|nr:hypothetical protein [Chlamydiota bacterium]